MRNAGRGQPNPWPPSRGQFDREKGDSRDFFFTSPGELEHSERPPKAFSAKSAAKAWPLFLYPPYDAFLVPPRGVFRGGVLETRFILPAHTDPIHFTVDPGSDTIARG
jgi:hypothetical protein